MRGLVPIGAKISRKAPSNTTSCPANAGHPVINACRIEKSSANLHVRCLLDRPPARTMTTESFASRSILAAMELVPRIYGSVATGNDVDGRKKHSHAGSIQANRNGTRQGLA